MQNNGRFQKIEDLTAYLEEHKKLLLLYALKNDVSIEHFESGKMSITISEKTAPDFVGNLQKVFEEATLSKWNIKEQRGTLGITIADREKSEAEEDKRKISQYPLVRAVLEEFKGAKFETVIRTAQTQNTEENTDQELINNFDEEYE